ncbi:hypothetical protein [Rhizosaccharibacter radicis]|uniref:Uncharacterized protein n=1 Tax=Rhizosaccharibacter radicis TaxID=2782605 RepID=A0ABT1VXQ6_9PROT|nr:hypothetical protein [Acetobacteraceae bacterium KSS12]
MPEQYQGFAGNGWVPQWRDLQVFTYHRYHTVHETRRVVRGSAVSILGGGGGNAIHHGKGDYLAPPAGASDAQLSASDGSVLIGAYTLEHPESDDVVLMRTADQRERLARIDGPPAHPVTGGGTS